MIKNIRIQNFRSLVDVSVDLDPLTVLIGRSGTGKSNFVDAIRFLRDLLTLRSINRDPNGWRELGRDYLMAQNGWDRLLHVDHHKDPIAYDLSFSISESEEEYRYVLSCKTRNEGIEESLKVGGRTLFHHGNGKWITQPGVIPTPEPHGVMLGAIPGIQESTFAYFALRTGIGCYDFPGDVISKAGNQVKRIQGQPVDIGLEDRGDNYLLIADRILSDLHRAHSWKRIAKGMRATSRTVGGLTLNAPNPDRLDVGHHLNGRLLSFDVRQESEGFRRYLAHLLALYQSPPKQTLLFEHPEHGLHPGALESLAEEFKDCPEDGRGQVVLTTHSPQLLNYFPADAIRVVDIKDQSTRIGPLAPEQAESLREDLLRPGELLTVDPARLPGQLDEVPG